MTEPAAGNGARFTTDAVEIAIGFTEGYPYFLQEFGQAAWNLSDDSTITATDAATAQSVVEEKLDSNFFKVRLDRTTALEEAYLRAMAELGPEAQRASDVAELLERTSQQCGLTRANLIDKGLLYTPEYGYAAFTVPQFDKYLKRALPELVVPPKRARGSRSQN